jgi:hypothetical protein
MKELSLTTLTAMASEEKSVQFRAQVPMSIDFLIRALVPLKNAGKDWTIGDIATEALTEWLLKPENRELVERHSLLEALERRGSSTDIYSE